MTRYVHHLNHEEVHNLKQRHRQTNDADVRSRCEMLLLSNEGLSPRQIAQRVRFSGRTVRRWIDRYEMQGLPGLSSQSPPGRPARVTAHYLSVLESAIEQFPRDLDLPFSNWTTQNLADYMAQQTDIRISARQVENYLKAQGWRLRRPVRTVKHKQDHQQVAEKKSNVGVLSASPTGHGVDFDVW